MQLEYKPDADKVIARMEAWWNKAILDRATIQVTAPKPNPKPLPEKQHATLREHWMDVEYVVERAAREISNTYYPAEQLPCFWPNLGPEVLTACYGAEMEFSETTSWSKPILHDWAGVPDLKLNLKSEYNQTLRAMQQLAFDIGKGKFLVGMTDIHPGADLAASFRDPQQFCFDVLEEPECVKSLMQHIWHAFFDFYESQREVLLANGQTLTTSWLPLFDANGRYYIPSNDFSIMISNEMFREYFIPEIVAEIEWLDRSIYHLDGPGALRHLDTLLEIKKLDAIQFVYGDGAKPASRWLHVYQKIQDAGKNIHVLIEPNELDAFMDALNPEGVMLHTNADSAEEADDLVERVSHWTQKGVY
jgi:hypothetical protein